MSTLRLPGITCPAVVVASLVAASATLSVATASADSDGTAGLLDGSTHALIMGPTFMPNPDVFPGYQAVIDANYLEPLGFSHDGTLTALITPESPWFGPSIAKGVDILVNTVEAGFNEHQFSAADPLTVVGYSQSTVIESLAEQRLFADGIPLDDLRFVMLGDAAADPPSGATGILDTWGATTIGQEIFNLLGWSNLIDVSTPNNLFPTDVFNVVDDFWATTVPPAEFSVHPIECILQDILGFFEHGSYLGGLPESEILDAIAGGGVPDGATTYFTLADPVNLLESLIDTALSDLGIPIP
jgi:hypothetical protein